MAELFFSKQKTAYEMRISDWSSDVCSSDLRAGRAAGDTACGSNRDPTTHRERRASADSCADRSASPQLRRTRDQAGRDARTEDTEAEKRKARQHEAHRLADIGFLPLQSGNELREDRKSTRLNPVTNAHLVCRLLLDKKKTLTKKNTTLQ